MDADDQLDVGVPPGEINRSPHPGFVCLEDAARKAGAIKDGECSYDNPEKIKSGKTRAEVKAECMEARKAGKIHDGEARP